MSENPRRGRQARNFTTNVLKILDRKSSSEQIFSENYRWVPRRLSLVPGEDINPHSLVQLITVKPVIGRYPRGLRWYVSMGHNIFY